MLVVEGKELQKINQRKERFSQMVSLRPLMQAKPWKWILVKFPCAAVQTYTSLCTWEHGALFMQTESICSETLQRRKT